MFGVILTLLHKQYIIIKYVHKVLKIFTGTLKISIFKKKKRSTLLDFFSQLHGKKFNHRYILVGRCTIFTTKACTFI